MHILLNIHQIEENHERYKM